MIMLLDVWLVQIVLFYYLVWVWFELITSVCCLIVAVGRIVYASVVYVLFWISCCGLLLLSQWYYLDLGFGEYQFLLVIVVYLLLKFVGVYSCLYFERLVVGFMVVFGLSLLVACGLVTVRCIVLIYIDCGLLDT